MVVKNAVAASRQILLISINLITSRIFPSVLIKKWNKEHGNKSKDCFLPT